MRETIVHEIAERAIDGNRRGALAFFVGHEVDHLVSADRPVRFRENVERPAARRRQAGDFGRRKTFFDRLLIRINLVGSDTKNEALALGAGGSEFLEFLRRVGEERLSPRPADGDVERFPAGHRGEDRVFRRKRAFKARHAGFLVGDELAGDLRRFLADGEGRRRLVAGF